ncbi:hypothetical protein PPYR_08294 [Photinus pyralis]|uniref:CYTH domain-containing protein n=1 Tax=Photinus pyralis TaxID=7054 RepID=A0A1Y1LPE8_PHOPY|nr:uncharacterized protein LOC116172786 [Photinus pyralis]KAB0797300.1 hypothetical protein PPYR_08294 [Photinus pyralis]
MRNVEIKAKVRNLHNLLVKAKLISESEGKVIPQVDQFYNSIQGRLKLRKFEDGSGELIYYDRPDDEGPKVSSYEKCAVDANLAELDRVLQCSLGSKGIVKKVRHLFMIGQTRLHVDIVEQLGNFMELEVVLNPEQSVEEGVAIANDLMEKLEIGKEDLLVGAYRDMLA